MLTFQHRFALREDERPADVFQCKQVHGREVLVVAEGASLQAVRRYEADVLVTRIPGTRVGVRTADCVPVLIEDPEGGACAAVHAGWRGLAAGAIGAAVAELGSAPSGMRAAIGPAIGPCCFEVGLEVAEQFPGFVVVGTKPAKPHVDLQGVARDALVRCGVGWVSDGPVRCTKCDPAGLYSYRRDGKGTKHHLHYIEAPTP